jgi:hypothetical protein
MIGIECVSDRATRAAASGNVLKIVQETAYQEGVMIRVSGPNIILSPPLILSQSEAAAILSALDTGFAAAR